MVRPRSQFWKLQGEEPHVKNRMATITTQILKWLKWFQKSQSCLLQSESNENLQKTPFSVG